MSGLPALLGDLHECALFDKHLQEAKQHTAKSNQDPPLDVVRKQHGVSDTGPVDSEQEPQLTLPGFRRSLLPFMLYSMWTRRSRFS